MKNDTAQARPRCILTEAEQEDILAAVQHYVNAAAEDNPDKAEVDRRLTSLYELIQRYKRRHAVHVIRNRVTPEDVARILGVTL